MALPTSTIVMALLTAIPFGLAIRDTATGKPSFEDQEIDRHAAESGRALQELEENRARHEAELEQVIEGLVPMQKRAELGIPGYAIGAPSPEARSAAVEKLETVASARVSRTLDASGNVRTVKITFPQYDDDQNVCLLVSQRVEEAWGPSERTYTDQYSRKHWSAVSPPQRATFSDDNNGGRCSVELEATVGVPDFVNKTEASVVPLWALGQPASKLVTKLGADAFSDETQIRWTKPGVGLGYGETELYARIAKGKVVTITAKYHAVDVTHGALLATLRQLYGEPTEEQPPTWLKPKLVVETVGGPDNNYLLVAGEPLPSDEE